MKADFELSEFAFNIEPVGNGKSMTKSNSQPLAAGNWQVANKNMQISEMLNIY